MGHKGFGIDFTLGSVTDREFIVTRLGWGVYVGVGELVKKVKRAHSISEALDVEFSRITTLAAPIPTWRCESEIGAHMV